MSGEKVAIRVVSERFQPNLTLYLVEDSAEFRDLLIERVAEHGLGTVVGWSDNEDAAIEDILQIEPDVVIIDIQLRVGNGLSALAKVRETLKESLPEVIVLTDFAFAQFGKYSIMNGASFFLDKASDLKQLETLLRVFGARLHSRGRLHKPVAYQ